MASRELLDHEAAGNPRLADAEMRLFRDNRRRLRLRLIFAVFTTALAVLALVV